MSQTLPHLPAKVLSQSPTFTHKKCLKVVQNLIIPNASLAYSNELERVLYDYQDPPLSAIADARMTPTQVVEWREIF
jgi:hypothetical protein